MSSTRTTPVTDAVEALDWEELGRRLDDDGVATTGPLLSADRAAR